ncbi:hypothetical protein SDJN03_11259, partial [Cucurbita argyrosperma subsp. sororia]
MGNCISSPHLYDLAVPVEKIAGLKLTSAVLEVGRGAATPPAHVLIDDDDDITKPAALCKLPKATIVVSKEQLEFLLTNSQQFGSQGIAVQFSDSFKFDRSCSRWCPVLPTILEVHNY